MKKTNWLTKSKKEQMTPFVVIMVILLGLAAVATAYFQVGRGPLAPTAPQSNPAAAELNANICSLDFTVDPANTPSANLQLRKTVNDSTPNVGEEVTFTIEVTNSGPNATTGVTVTDLLPQGVTYVSDNSANGDYNPNLNGGTWTIGAIAVNQTVSLNIVVRVDVAGEVTNMGQVASSDLPDPNSTPANSNPDEDDQDDSTLNSDTPGADLQLTKSVNNATPRVGENITFTVRVYNDGPDATTNLTVRDVLPDGFTYVSFAGPGVYDPNLNGGTWTVGNLAANTAVELQIVATVTQSAPRTNIAQVYTSALPDPNSTPGNSNPNEDDQDYEVVDPQEPTESADLRLSKTVNNSRPQQGDIVTFTVQLVNDGPNVATGVKVEDILPSGLSYDSQATPSQDTYNQSTGIWDVGTLAVNATAQIQVRAKVNTTSSIRNIAQVEASDQYDPDSVPSNDRVEDDYGYVDLNPSTTGADLQLTKRVNNQAPQVGEIITYTVEVRNGGPNQANDIEVRDLIPRGVRFEDANPSQGNYDSASGIWKVGSLTLGSTARIDMRVTVETTSAVRNIAEVWRSSEPDPNSTPANNNPNEDDYDEVTIGRAGLPRSGTNSSTTLFVVAAGVVVLIIGAVGVLLLL